MVLAICPGVPLVVRHSHRQHGDPTLTLLILIASALTAIVLVPLWGVVLAHLTPLDLHVRIRDVAAVLAPTLLVPFLLGRLVVYTVPRFAAPLAYVANILFVVGIAIIVLVALSKIRPALYDLGEREIVAGLIITAAALVLGWFAARGSRPQRISVAFAAALGNPVLALSLVTREYDFHAVPWLLGLVVLRALALVPFKLWLRRTAHGES
jgi:predicted Na+-dependent transporter